MSTPVPLSTVEDVERLDAADVPRALCWLAALQTALAARLATVPPPPAPTCPGDITDDVAEVACIARRSVSWVRKNGHKLPGFRQPGGKGTRVAWSRQALETWAVQATS